MRYSEYLKRETGGGLPPTPPDILGPFYKDGSPERTDISEGLPDSFTLSGQVMDGHGTALADVLLDIWQADPQGAYDNDGFRHRGKVRTDKGRSPNYEVRTVMPGCYEISETESRCPHIHVKVSAVGFKPLTTQLYFPGAEHNDTDRWHDRRREVRWTVSWDETARTAMFDFVLEPEAACETS